MLELNTQHTCLVNYTLWSTKVTDVKNDMYCLPLNVRCFTKIISIPLPLKVLAWPPPPTPHLNSSIASYFSLKILAFETSQTSEFSKTFYQVGMDKFWHNKLQPHNRFLQKNTKMKRHIEFCCLCISNKFKACIDR